MNRLGLYRIDVNRLRPEPIESLKRFPQHDLISLQLLVGMNEMKAKLLDSTIARYDLKKR